MMLESEGRVCGWATDAKKPIAKELDDARLVRDAWIESKSGQLALKAVATPAPLTLVVLATSGLVLPRML